MAVQTFTKPGSLNEKLAVNREAPATMADTSKQNATPTKETTFGAQDSLPKLPIPDLKHSCDKYLEALLPLQSPREHQDTKAAVKKFLETDGPELNDRLKKYATGKTSYIEQFWYDSYLNFDNPVVLNLNPFFLLEDDPTPARNNQVTRAASLVISSLCFVRAVRKEELVPDKVRGTPLCMYQYSRLFGVARVPTESGCHIGQDDKAKHIVVICRGQFYWFDVLDDNNDLIMTEKDMALNLQSIVEDAQETPIQEAAKGALGVLTTENRKIWAGLREVLSRDEGSNNAESLSTIDSALFIVCLDYTEPQTSAELCGNMLCGSSQINKGVQIGTCTNRWYDKLQIIVCQNGSAGINFEHTGVDGHTVLRFASDVYTDTILRFAKSINGQAPSLWKSNSPDPSKRDPESFGNVSTTPHKLEWEMVPELSTSLRFAETRLADLIQQNEFQTLDFASYGKNFMTSMGFSPDAFVQMAFQAAYFGLYGRVECTYEPAMTKMFLHGRTEAIRSVTPESLDFVKIFWGDNPAQQKIDALQKATQKHTAVTRECSKAQGQDRHLYALFCVWQRAVDKEGAEAASSNGNFSSGSDDDFSRSASPTNGTGTTAEPRSTPSPSRSRSASGTGGRVVTQIPALFADAGWDKINNTILSTSNCGNPALRQFGFGPTSGDGFGIGYIIKDDSISICASSKHRQTKRFVDSIESYLLEIRRILRATRQRTSEHKASRVREVEERNSALGTGKGSRAAAGGGGGRKLSTIGMKSPGSEGESKEESDDELGGYGFFDAGMLLQALKANSKNKEAGAGIDGNESPAVAARRNVGKKLRLSEY